MDTGGAAFKSDGTGTFLTQPDTSAPLRIPSIIVSFCNRFKDMTPIDITRARLLTRLPGTALTRMLTNRNSSCQLTAWRPHWIPLAGDTTAIRFELQSASTQRV